MLFKLHLPTLPEVFLFCLPKCSSMTIYTHLNQCCCSPVSAPSFFAAALAVAQCHGLGRQPAPSSRARWVHECQCWHHSTGSEPTAAGTLKWPSWWAVLPVPLLIRLFSLLQFKYHTKQESKWRISLSIHKLLHSPSDWCHAIFIDFYNNTSRAD